MSKREKVIGWRVRVWLNGGAMHLLSRTEPMTIMRDGQLIGMHWDLVAGTGLGDTLGWIDWSKVTSVSWRDGSGDTIDPETGQDLAVDD